MTRIFRNRLLRVSIAALVMTVSAESFAQDGALTNPDDTLKDRWLQICVNAQPGSELQVVCAAIIGSGGVEESEGRRLAAARGNNLGIFAAQVKLARSWLGRRQGATSPTGRDRDEDNASLGLDGGDDQMLWQSERWGVFGNVLATDVQRDQSRWESAFKSKVLGASLGVDYRINANVVALFSLGVRDNDTDFDRGIGEMNQDSRGILFGLYGNRGEHFGWQVTLGRENLDLTTLRQIRFDLPLFPGTPQEQLLHIDRTAVSDLDGHNTHGSISADWSWWRGAWAFRSEFGGDFSRVELGSGVERNGGGFELRFDQRNNSSRRAHVAFEVSRTNSANWGVWSPSLRLDWFHEFADDGSLYPASFAADSSDALIGFASEDPHRSFGNLSLGISAVRPNGWQWFITLDRSIGNSTLRETRLNAGFRKSL